jgi:hypothetical protein
MPGQLALQAIIKMVMMMLATEALLQSKPVDGGCDRSPSQRFHDGD